MINIVDLNPTNLSDWSAHHWRRVAQRQFLSGGDVSACHETHALLIIKEFPAVRGAVVVDVGDVVVQATGTGTSPAWKTDVKKNFYYMQTDFFGV